MLHPRREAQVSGGQRVRPGAQNVGPFGSCDTRGRDYLLGRLGEEKLHLRVIILCPAPANSVLGVGRVRGEKESQHIEFTVYLKSQVTHEKKLTCGRMG